MIADGRALLAGLCLCAFVPSVHADVPQEALEAVNEESWRKAIIILRKIPDDPNAQRLLGLSYFQASDYDQAFPLIESAHRDSPDDPQINSAMLKLRLARQEWDEARILLEEVELPASPDQLEFVRLQIDLGADQGNRSQAKADLRKLLENPEVGTDVALDAADLLIRAHLDDLESHAVYEVARLAIDRDPNSPGSNRYSQYMHESQGSGEFHYDLAYRLEFDDNVCLTDTSVATGKEDFRQVFLADILFEKPLQNGLSFYAQGNLFRTFHNDLSQFDFSRLKVSAALGKRGEKSGWRLPIEVNQDRLDGGTFRDSIALTPAYYIQFSKNLFSHFYARIQQDEYDPNPSELLQRDEDVLGLGVLVAGRLTPKFNLRSYVEINQHDSDQSEWERDELVLFANSEYTIKDNWTAGLAFRYVDVEYENPNPLFRAVQENESKEIYLNLTHKFRHEWTWRGQVSLIDASSNIPLFNYDRNVFSFSVSREF